MPTTRITAFSLLLSVSGMSLGFVPPAIAQRRSPSHHPAPAPTPPQEEIVPPDASGDAPEPQPPQPAAEPAPQSPPPPSPAADLGPLYADLAALLDDMVSARARIALVGQELFSSRLTIDVQDRTGNEAAVARFALELDGTPVHRTDGELDGADGRRLFEGGLAPGPHVLTVEFEQRAADDPEYRVSSRESFRFIVVRDRSTEVTLVLEDDSNIARSFRESGEGHFEIKTRMRVATRALGNR